MAVDAFRKQLKQAEMNPRGYELQRETTVVKLKKIGERTLSKLNSTNRSKNLDDVLSSGSAVVKCGPLKSVVTQSIRLRHEATLLLHQSL